MILDLNITFGLAENRKELLCPQVPKPEDFLFINKNNINSRSYKEVIKNDSNRHITYRSSF